MKTQEPTDLTGTTIGIIGLGLMGQPMAANLLKAGARLVIPTRSQHTLTEFSENQVEALETPREIVQAAETSILMLPDAEAVESVLKDPDGLLDGADAKTTVVDMGTTEAG